MQAVRYGKPHPERYRLKEGRKEASLGEGAPTPSWGYGVHVLEEADCQPSGIPVASAHPLYTAALFHIEGDADDKNTLCNSGNDRNVPSRIDEHVVLSEQRREMARDELLFWERVEFIRCSQLASIPGGVKRSYTDQDSTVFDDVKDKIELRFTQ
ncbi:unnamed protein product [Phytomonas sp. Hart1]|nr:unnamed protein product [Phytomonas sp. Hart1]|eukprot:CCW69730.1 unnamed protein product [Phytomonas sp. isolate Hart1]